MREIFDCQKRLLKKVFLYNSSDFSLAPYFCTYAYNLGFYQMKFWLNKSNIFKFILVFFREIYSLINTNSYEVKGNLENFSEYKSVVITWGNDKNIKNDSFIDHYFNTSKQDKSVLWIVIFSGKNIFYDDNVINIIEKNSNFFNNIKNFIYFIFNLLIEKKNIHKFTNNYFSSKKLEKVFIHILKKKNLTDNCKFFFPYESQPFQNNLIKNLKSSNKNFKTFGYIHSFPAFPSHLVKKTINPDFLIINSKDQIHAFTNFLKWENKEIHFLPSLRFQKKIKNNLTKQIFLPIKFNSIKDICIKIRELNKIYNLKEFKVRNHPAAISSKKHLKLIDQINKITYHNDVSQLDPKTSIFIGSTGAIIESLFNGIEPIHIMEDIEFEIYSEKLWPSIKSNFIKDKIVKYKLIDENIVKLENNFMFNSYLKL